MVSARTTHDDPDLWPDGDGKPIAENTANRVQMTDLIFALERALAERERFVVGGNQMMYYDINDRRHHVSPDVYAALDVEPGARQKWQTWREDGLFPQVVFEISSPSTVRVDLGSKRHLYARLGVEEYYIFDPLGAISPAFQCFRRSGQRLVPVPIIGNSIYSETLGLELRIVDSSLRAIDPRTDTPFPTPEEEHLARIAAEQARIAAEERALQLEAQLRDALARLSDLSRRDEPV